ncbi:peptidase [Streptomyces sp. NPDC051219]|uniref:peptidase n=1 Tax=Streptomyces sp. NPDC051219 TaxID=3155283 RepID=UPI003443F4A8
MRRAAAGLAAAGLLAVGLSTPAQAADPVFTLSGDPEVGLRPFPATGSPQKATVDIQVTSPGEEAETGRFDGEYTVSIDLSGIAGVAEARFGETGSSDCKITGATAVCTDYGIWPGLNSVAQLELTAARGSELGATGAITVTGKAEGATFTSFSSQVTVGGPDLVMKPLGLKRNLQPGEVQPVRVSFTNAGTTAADGVLLTLRHSRGMAFTEQYDNCEYSEGGNDIRAFKATVCWFEGSYEPGAVYELAEPLHIKATDIAFIDSLIYRISEDSPAVRTAQRAGLTFARGTGPELTLVRKTASPKSADLDPRNNQQEFDFLTENTADFAAFGPSLKAAAGETVKAKIGFRNKGPAWVGYIRTGESVATVDFTVPAGAEVTGKPESCRGVTAAGGHREKQLGAPRYVCDTSAVVLEDAKVVLPFELKIEKVVRNATGAVAVRAPYQSRPQLAFDPKPSNDTARLVLNAKDTGTSTGGGSTGGDAGQSTGSASASGASASGTSAGSSAGTSAGSSTGTAGGSTGGALAATGTGSATLPAVGAAAAALVTGGVLFLSSRRRASRV